MVTEKRNAYKIREWVKIMKQRYQFELGEREVFKWLVGNNYIFKNQGTGYLPYAKYEDNGLGYFTVELVKTDHRVFKQTKITGKGIFALTKKVIEHFNVNSIEQFQLTLN